MHITPLTTYDFASMYSYVRLRSHWSEIKHGAAAEELKSSLRVGMASVAAHSVASGASRESESCALLVELAANEMKVRPVMTDSPGMSSLRALRKVMLINDHPQAFHGNGVNGSVTTTSIP